MISDFRDQMIQRLREDLMGPMAEGEVLTDRPTQRYSTGILYPADSQTPQEENEDGGMAVNIQEDAASTPDVSGTALHSTMKPATAGLSFAIEQQGGDTELDIGIRCALYRRFAVDDQNAPVDGEPPDRTHERWRREPIEISRKEPISAGETSIDLSNDGAAGLELYFLVIPHGKLLTVTAALSNCRHRGTSRVYDEEQHFFQCTLEIRGVTNGEFAPRPSRRAETDDDSRAAALIYRDVKEFVVGHTSSARAELGPDGKPLSLLTEWLPAAEVRAMSDLGDPVFEGLRSHPSLRPLDAAWLESADPGQLSAGLTLLVEAYEAWITQREAEAPQLPPGLQAQAHRHLVSCRLGANRMRESIALIGAQADVRTAFQLSQEAMRLQFGWSRRGDTLMWRPFQLGFQMLALASLGERTHPDREIMDLLWFPTGGGKTEAYLALTAFIIMLRRLRRSDKDDGAGVSVIMRYTLRLLTVQQFQRAAAMICACELLRRGRSELGTRPIGIGLWVGAAATPLTLVEACRPQPGDPSSAKQLVTCPCCGISLAWRITPRESLVECPSEPGQCAYAAKGPSIPVWTIDEEVYRHAPSLVIGTVDKFAQIVRKPETGALFGRGTGNAPPDLIIQDELHLISGPLGSVAGLYEVAVDELCRREAVRPKIIGSTATIRRASEQTRSLFDRVTYQFPAPGLHADNSGFAMVDVTRPGRTYVGVTTAGRSATYMLQALAASLLQGATSPLSQAERDFYWTLVVYFNSLRELGRALVLMQDDVPVTLQQIAALREEQARPTEAPAELTSRVRSYEVLDMLAQLSKSVGDPEAVDLLLASNMISVGMDIPRLGVMLVNAQPKSMSEYIQATSRVGRDKVPGLIVTMYNNTRTRDRCHYETFETWHRCLYREVEASSVTPFAARAQDKALHAVLVALVRHLVPGMATNPVLNTHGRAQAEQLAAVIEQRVARVDSDEGTLVSQKLRRLLDEWASRPDLECYWDDYGRRISLLMSAEQYAAKADVDPDLDSEGARRALWPTPNSMRAVEAGVPFILRNVLKGGDA